MARIARLIAPGFPHHSIQGGNRRQQTFFSDSDYQSYIELMAEWFEEQRVDIWVYCLMPNQIRLVAVPETRDSLRLAIGEAHCRYTRRVNFREGWRGHLWQGRFSSFVMEETYLKKETAALRKHEHTGRPLGSDKFVERLKSQIERVLRPNKPGPKPLK